MANGHGGARKGAGRKPGQVSEAKKQIAEQAKEYGEQALATLADLMLNGESESTRIQSAVALLDRGYGKPTQANEHTGAGGGPVELAIRRVIVES